MQENKAYLVISAIPNPENIVEFKLYLSKIIPLFLQNGGIEVGRYKTLRPVIGSSGVLAVGVFEFSNEQVINTLLESSAFLELRALRNRAFSKLDLMISELM